MLTDTYRKQLEELHKDPDARWGNDGKFHAQRVLRLCNEVHAASLLDFGCGRSSLTKTLKAAGTKMKLYDYDPGKPKKAVLPRGPFDVVVCTDVMEHVEPQFVDEVLQAIAARTLKRAFFVIDCIPAQKLLPDGRNAHLTVHAPIWWVSAVVHAFGHGWGAHTGEDRSGKKVDIVVTKL